MMADHIHTPKDGRGIRDVFVNGNKIDGVFRADTKKGEVWFYPQPPRLNHRRDGVYARRLRGNVEVYSRG